jgi:hypothetical protein
MLYKIYLISSVTVSYTKFENQYFIESCGAKGQEMKERFDVERKAILIWRIRKSEVFDFLYIKDIEVKIGIIKC